MASNISSQWMKNYLQGKKKSRQKPAAAPKPAAAKSKKPRLKARPSAKPQGGSRAPTPRSLARTRSPSKVKKGPGFVRQLTHAYAREALKGTGHVGHVITKKIGGIRESDGAGGLGGTPINNASSGAVQGLGTGPQEPGVKKKTKAPFLSYKLFKRSKSVK